MNNWTKVARFHLSTEAAIYSLGLWYLVALVFLVVWIIFFLIPYSPASPYRPDPGPVMAMVVACAASGFLSITKSLPFALALGVSRRAYYTGTALLGAGLPAIYGLLLVILQVVENATNGWGVRLEAFHAPWILQGPWYQSWWTLWATLALGFLYGMWCGIIHWRWRFAGLMTFFSLQVGLLLLTVIVASERHAWHSIWHFFAAAGAVGVTNFVTILAAILLIAGMATIRRVTV